MLIAIKRTDGGVSIMNIFDQAATIEGEVEKWKDVHIGEYVSHVEIKEIDIPPDRTFRNAWTSDGKIIKHDIAKCRDIWKEKMRSARAPILGKLDADYLKADEQADVQAKAMVAAQKQELRDVTNHPDIAAASTPEALKLVWPSILGDKVP